MSLFSAHNLASSGHTVCKYSIGNCGAGFVVGLQILNGKGAKTKVLEISCTSRGSCSTVTARKKHYVSVHLRRVRHRVSILCAGVALDHQRISEVTVF